ncbi:efflux RND transporter periplasmic adaptor subunit [Sporomusa sp. GT1]|uniref:efflux RND transporter periplasmic adaptor subunit n=1 Tax=Sporomusa sp. GT1 TaxID=1534747 RepID=UPI0016647381|nr:efflux RND transporter periplasmic adaptor subunit [Sporomusa sp. GT1]
MKMLTKNSRLLLALTVLVCAAALLLAVSSKQLPTELWPRQISPQAPVNLTAIPLGTINKPIQVTRTGSLESAASVPIHAAFSGHPSEIYVTEGQTIKAGQPLLKLQPSPSAVTQQAAVPSQQLQTNYDNALKEYDRYQKLYEIGAIPRRQMESITAKLQEAKERLAATGTQSAGSITGPTTITAPIDGIVTGLAAAPAKEVQAGQLLLSLGSGQEVGAVVQLEQKDLYLVQLGTPVIVEAAQQTIVGQVASIYPQVEAKQNPVFLAHIKLASKPAESLKAGMPATIHINTGETAVVPAVPTASILQDSQGQTYVYLAVNGKAVLQQISVGKTMDDFTEITSSLPAESLVIISSLDSLRDGDTITVIQHQ